MTFVTRKLNGKWAVYRKGADRPVLAGITTRSEAIAWRDFYIANPNHAR